MIIPVSDKNYFYWVPEEAPTVYRTDKKGQSQAQFMGYWCTATPPSDNTFTQEYNDWKKTLKLKKYNEQRS
jgi:hypothetical protein